MLDRDLMLLSVESLIIGAVCGVVVVVIVAIISSRRWRLVSLQRLGVYTSIMDAAPEALAVVGADYRYQVVNRAFVERTHRTRESIIGHTVREVMGSEVFDETIKPKLDQALAGEQVRYQAWQQFPGHGLRLMLVDCVPYRTDPNGQDVDGALVCAHDVTELKRAEREQLPTEQALQAMWGNSPVLACIKDPELRILNLNKRGEELLGVRQDQVVGRRAEDVLPAQLAHKITAPDRRVLQTMQPETIEELLPTPKGDRTLMSTCFPWLDGEDNLSAICTLSLDVTDLRAGREAQQHAAVLRESEHRFRVLLDELPTLNWLTDAEGRIEYVNRRFAEYFGATAAQVGTVGSCSLVHPDDLSRVKARISEAVTSRQAFNIECRVQRADQRWRWAACSARPLFEGNGRFVGFVGSCRDIERRKQVFKAYHQSRKQLKEHAFQLGMLAKELTRAEQRERQRLAQVLHDNLQQLLVGAIMASGRVKRHLRKSGEHELAKLGMLLDETMTASRNLMSDLWPQILSEGSFAEALQWLAQTMRKRYELVVRLELDSSVSPSDQMLRVFLFECVREALFNVIKHAGVLQTQVKMRKQDENNLQIVISDRGRGLDANIDKHNLSAASSHLGLLSMRERMRLLGGAATVTDNPGGGTLVTLIAPLEATEEPEQAIPPRPLAEPAAPSLQEPQGSPPRTLVTVLLVDDHALVREALSSSLAEEDEWLQVIGEASNGRDAIDEVERLLPDIVLMDFNMPEMDGLEATRIIHRRWPSIRIIGLSLHHETDRARTMLEAGAVDYICKTSVTQELLDKIRLHADIESDPLLPDYGANIESSAALRPGSETIAH